MKHMFFCKKRIKCVMSILLIFSVICLGGCNAKDSTGKKTYGKISKEDLVKKDVDTEENETNDDTTKTGDEIEEVQKEVLYPITERTLVVNDIDIYTDDFETGTTSFTGRGDASAAINSVVAYSGSSSLYVSGRTQFWNGATVDLSTKMLQDKTYQMSAMLYYDEGPTTLTVSCKVEQNGSSYLNFAEVLLTKGEWKKIDGSITLPDTTKTASVYFETKDDLASFYVDDLTIVERQVDAERGDIPSLKEVYKDMFLMGCSVTASEISPERQELLKEQFNSITCGNELKPDSLLDYETCISNKKYDTCPAINFSKATPILDFAYQNGFKLRGHTLVWHSQTPRWFFTVGYSKDANAPFVSKEIMLQRMENYIRQVVTYMQENYPGLVYCWDVVNEAINYDGAENGYRSKDSYWYQTIGEEFVEKAFEYARKYTEDGVKLFYNDYGEYDTSKMYYILNMLQGLVDKGLVDGMGMQHHIGLDSPSALEIQVAIEQYAKLGLEIHITELDVDMKTNTDADYMKQAKRYKKLFLFYKNLVETGKANITSITFWGLSDDVSWLSNATGKSYPLLFDEYLLPKLAFYGVIQSDDIPLY